MLWACGWQMEVQVYVVRWRKGASKREKAELEEEL
jgi:hypothetical protein